MVRNEREFVASVCADMSSNGWLYDSVVKPSLDRGIVEQDLVEWVRKTQREAWRKLCAHFGNDVEEKLADCIRAKINELGTLEVLRSKDLEIKHESFRVVIKLMQHNPEGVVAADLKHHYESNILRVCTEVEYDKIGARANRRPRLDMVLTINGVPTATAEFKCDSKQSVDNAKEQYCTDRWRGGGSTSLLLSPYHGALAHFAVSDVSVYVTGCLKGIDTVFLPFNKFFDDEVVVDVPDDRVYYNTEFLWREVWAWESWINLCHDMIKPVGKSMSRALANGWIFPRYHQWDVVCKSLSAVKHGGVGDTYLIQHSAGSGKTKTIAWLANALEVCKDSSTGEKLFEGIIILSDRNVIDQQLFNQLHDFQSMSGIVERIDSKGQGKGVALSRALEEGKRIIVCTMQTFVGMTEGLRRRGGHSEHYAILADEAHGFQLGDTAKHMHKVIAGLGGKLESEADDSACLTDRYFDSIKKWMGDRLTFFAFTATPTSETLACFGTRPNPALPVSELNKPVPFHLYSMKQAIEEKFILDVLENYIEYQMYAQVSLVDDRDNYLEVDSTGGQLRLKNFVHRHKEAVDYRAAEIIKHFVWNVRPLIDGQGKAMVVTGSRDEAVNMARALYQKSHELCNNGKGLLAPPRIMVAFSGSLDALLEEEVENARTEASINREFGMSGGDVAKVFDRSGDILVVANKYQTGFDQPRLCGMYLDRGLSGVQAVQTLSRLNRMYKDKNKVFILDFMNQRDTIIDSFKPYYSCPDLMSNISLQDMNDLYFTLKSGPLYTEEDVLAVFTAFSVWSLDKSQYKENILTQNVTNFVKKIIDEKDRLERTLAGLSEDHPNYVRYSDQMDELLVMYRNMQKYVRAYEYFYQMEYFRQQDGVNNKRFHCLYIVLFYVLPRLHFSSRNKPIELPILMLSDYELVERSLDLVSMEDGEVSLQGPKIVMETNYTSSSVKSKTSMEVLLDKFHEKFGMLMAEENILRDNGNGFVETIVDALSQKEVILGRGVNQWASNEMSKNLSGAIIGTIKSYPDLSRWMLNNNEARDDFGVMIAHKMRTDSASVSDVLM